MLIENHKISGVSTAIRTTMSAYETGSPLDNLEKNCGFPIKVANTLEEKESAFRLEYQVYLQKGYFKKKNLELLINSYGVDMDTAT